MRDAAIVAVVTLAFIGCLFLIMRHDRKPMEWRGAPTDTVCPVSSDLGKRCVGGGKVLWCVESFRDDVITCAPLPGGAQ